MVRREVVGSDSPKVALLGRFTYLAILQDLADIRLGWSLARGSVCGAEKGDSIYSTEALCFAV